MHSRYSPCRSCLPSLQPYDLIHQIHTARCPSCTLILVHLTTSDAALDATRPARSSHESVWPIVVHGVERMLSDRVR